MKLIGKTKLQIEKEKLIDASKSARLERDRRLSSCDWTQVADAPVDANLWKIYRQALRDVPSQDGFPDNIEWPIEPSS